MGRRAAETTNPVPALGVPLTGGRVVLEQKWGPLCSVGVQTSPGLCSLPSLKRRSQPVGTAHGVTASMETMSLDRVKPAMKQALQNCTGKVFEDDTSQDGGIYCQVNSVRTNPSHSGCRGNLKRMPRYTNGSIVAPELVGGVSCEGAETREVDAQSQVTVNSQRRGQSLRSEKSVSSYTTPTRFCRTTMSPHQCSTCGRKQPQAPPYCHNQSIGQTQASMTLPDRLRKDLHRRQKQPSADTSTANPSNISISAAQALKTHDSKSQKRDLTSPGIKTPTAEGTMQPIHNTTSKNNTAAICLSKKEIKPKLPQHTQTHNTLTSISKAESKATHSKKHTPQKHTPQKHTPQDTECTEECVNKQIQAAPADKLSAARDPPKPASELPTGTESKATPTPSCNISSHSKETKVTSQPVSPEPLIGSKTTPYTTPLLTTQEPKSKADPETKPHPEVFHPLQNDMPEIPQCNGVPAGLHGLLQDIEENLMSNQEKIKVLLNVIQDLEKSKALSEGRCSYRTGQDINNCTTCQKTACTIYSVEHDFRLQEMRLQNVLEALDVECDTAAPLTKATASRPRTRNLVKKFHKKCFWWL
ncbi:uncharacterized protein insyn2b [Brachyhypopomus gauderio]|uniref:uncharacterized protein insyn2b n=1 Tax=Brachyhypopomus gauderio TaxID=698409 RepID=UPI004041AC33